MEARAGVCAGVKHCHRVAIIDVDGDHRADRVGWHQLSKKKVQIRVRTADGELLKRKVGVRRWYGGGAWGGAAWIDGRRGAELPETNRHLLRQGLTNVDLSRGAWLLAYLQNLQRNRDVQA